MKTWVKNIVTKLAITSPYDTFKHGSAIFKSGRILGKGTNSPIRKMTKMQNAYSVHAEYAAIEDAGPEHCKNATIFVARISHDGLRLSKPCPMCELWIRAAGIKRVIYSINNNTWAQMDF